MRRPLACVARTEAARPPATAVAAPRYGTDLVPCEASEIARMRFAPRIGGPGADAAEEFKKALQVVGFAPAGAVPRSHYTDSAYAVLPWPQKTHPSGLWKSGGVSNVEAAKCVCV